MQHTRPTEARLFAQVAARIRHRIATGQLIPGDRLPSLRDGAREWGVNLHTVRRAYAQLESEGLVETADRAGTVVAATDGWRPSAHLEEVSSFLSWVTDTARARFGLSRAEVAERLLGESGTDPRVWVLECSASLASELALKVAEWTSLPVEPWLVSRASELPEGYYLGTYYHYSELRSALAGRRHAPAFFAVHFDDEYIERLRSAVEAAGRLVLLAVESRSGKPLLADLRSALGTEAEMTLQATRRPRAALEAVPARVPVVLSPENWDRLSPSERAAPFRFPVLMQPVVSHLERISATFGWRRSV